MTQESWWQGRLRDWGAVELCLQEPWAEVADRSAESLWRRRVVVADPGLVLSEAPGRLRARHRRGLHRAGFRLTPQGVWRWSPPTAPPPVPAAGTDVSAWLEELFRWEDEAEAGRREVAIHVLREVFRCRPQDLAVCLVQEVEDDEYDDEGGVLL